MRVLIFATTYLDSVERMNLLKQWLDQHDLLNPECDLLLVDTPQAPLTPFNAFDFIGRHRVHQFPDNIGHMGKGGRDGWGRAFSKGIEIAIAEGYDYVAHIEGDSLFRLPIKPICEEMWGRSIHVASVPVIGTKKLETGWVETGLMVMSVAHVKAIDLVGRYNWAAGGKLYPKNPPEKVIFDLLGGDLTMMPWHATRDQARRVQADAIARLDWITQTTEANFDAFHSSVMKSIDYTSDFFAMHEQWCAEYYEIADIIDRAFRTDLPWLAKQLGAVDLGCGNAYIINRLESHGWDVMGVDASPEVLKHFPDAVIADLTKPLVEAKNWPLVICTEVAEHLPPEAADTLVGNIVRAGDVVVFSAAKSGRGGHLHINEQPARYWIEKFAERGFIFDHEKTMRVRWDIAERTSAVWWFAVNTMIFRRSTIEGARAFVRNMVGRGLIT